jgi:quercetin dioxygenase-like cupin family protein
MEGTENHMKTLLKMTLLGGGLLVVIAMALAVDQPAPVVITNDSGKWVDCPGMPTGCQMLRLYGDASAPGEFAVRFKYQGKYRIGPHTHAVDEHATVISGGPFHVAVGDTFDERAPSGQTLQASDLIVVPAGIHHFAWTDGETILQVNGIGPFKRNFLNPADNSSGIPK